MVIGIEQFRDARELRLDRMLAQPLRGEAGGQVAFLLNPQTAPNRPARNASMNSIPNMSRPSMKSAAMR